MIILLSHQGQPSPFNPLNELVKGKQNENAGCLDKKKYEV